MEIPTESVKSVVVTPENDDMDTETKKMDPRRLAFERRFRKRRQRRPVAEHKPPAQEFSLKFMKRIEEFSTLLSDIKIETLPEDTVLDELFDGFFTRLRAFQEELNTQTGKLTSYDLRQCQKAVDKSKTVLFRTKGRMQPPKRFRFTSKKALEYKEKSKDIVVADVEDKKKDFKPEAVYRFADLVGETIVQFTEDNEDVALQNLKDCTIILPSAYTFLWVEGLENCHIYSGPVSGALHITNVRNSEVHMACHQLRIHKTFNTHFYVFVGSNPIIEHCNGLKFSPYVMEYATKAGEFEKCCLKENFFRNVEDFNWLKSIKSPNWIAVETEEIDYDNIDIQVLQRAISLQ
ncbi:hypothetical protein PCE1_004209 [Barthelona sp. PCE]